MTLAEMEDIAQATIAAFPGPFRKAAMQVALRVAERPDTEMLAALGLSDPLELTGLYEGIPMTEKSTADQAQMPDAVWLFRGPILAEWRERGNIELEELITHVVVHEFAHHFGWSDDDIARVDRWWE